MKSLISLHKYFIKYKWQLLLGILFVALSTIFGVYQGVFVREGTNEIVAIFRDKTEVSAWVFIRYGIILLVLALLSGVFMFLMRQTIIVMSRHIEFDQKNELYQHYQQLDTAFYKQNSTGDLMNRISEDIGKVRMYTGPAIMYVVNTVATVITVLVFMLSVNAELTAFVFLPLPLLSYLIYRVSDLINKRSTKVQEELSRLTSHTQETFSAVRVIKAYAREQHYADEFDKQGNNYRRHNLSLSRIESFFQPIMVLMVGLSVVVTIWYGGRLVIDHKIEPGNISEFVFYVFKLTWPFASLGWVTSLIQRAAASQTRIDEFMKVKPGIWSPTEERYALKGDIEFKNVSFTYPDTGIRALKNMSLHLPQGSTLGIVGQVGSGKSTIANLLLRMYDVQEGKILIDGKALPEHNLSVIRQNTGYVPQEVFLFSDTIANNIAFSAGKQFNTAQIEEAAKKAAVYDNIMKFPEGMATMVGERGVTLSGGQKQRISIARAIIAQPQILVFDDCLSAVDTETEDRILRELKTLMQHKTSIIISHRISSIRHADKIIYLKNGEILEEGTHEQLLEKQGEYSKLYQLQNL